MEDKRLEDMREDHVELIMRVRDTLPEDIKEGFFKPELMNYDELFTEEHPEPVRKWYYAISAYIDETSMHPETSNVFAVYEESFVFFDKLDESNLPILEKVDSRIIESEHLLECIIIRRDSSTEESAQINYTNSTVLVNKENRQKVIMNDVGIGYFYFKETPLTDSLKIMFGSDDPQMSVLAFEMAKEKFNLPEIYFTSNDVLTLKLHKNDSQSIYRP